MHNDDDEENGDKLTEENLLGSSLIPILVTISPAMDQPDCVSYKRLLSFFFYLKLTQEEVNNENCMHIWNW